MRDLLSGHGSPAYLDETASRFLNEGRDAYKRLDLDRRTILEQGPYCTLVTWLGDSSNEALGCLLSRFGLTAVAAGPGLEIAASIDTVDRVERAIADIAADEPPTINELLQNAKNLEREKWDWALPRSLLEVSFASLNLDLIEARQWCTAAAASGVLATPRNN
jgi:ATP-dependent Lhr-like helicase